MSDYNGYKNRATWNVALWLCNDYGLYTSMLDYARHRKAEKRRATYRGFIEWAGLKGQRTPDCFKYDGKTLCHSELSAVIRESIEE